MAWLALRSMFAPRKNDLCGLDSRSLRRLGAIRAPVNNRVNNQPIRMPVAIVTPPQGGRLRGRFFTDADHGAHSRCAPAMPPLRPRTASDQRAALRVGDL
jgi:hypothetical protein